MVTQTKLRRRWQLLRVIFSLALLMLGGRSALCQELKQASSSLAAKIAESGRKRVAVVDFTGLQGNVRELGRYLAEELSGALVNDARGFHVMDRAHLKAILQEHKLSSTGLIDTQTARQLGQFAGVDTLVTGTITSAFGDSVRMMVKALDVSTAEIIAQSSADIPKTDAIKSLLAQGIPGASTGDTGPNPSEPPRGGVVSVQANNFLFLMKICKRAGEGLTCEGSVTNHDRHRRPISFWDAEFVDNLRYEYPSSGGNAHFRTGQRGAELEPDLPYNFWAEQKDVEPSATMVTVVMQYCMKGFCSGPIWEQWEKVSFRKVPIK